VIARLGRGVRWLSVAVATSTACVLTVAAAQTDGDLLRPPPEAWPQHGRVPEGHRYSPLAQIDRHNVGDLRLVWSRELGFTGTLQGGPTVWDGRLFLAAPGGVMAFDATTGESLWDYREPDSQGGSVVRPLLPRGAPLLLADAVIVSLRAAVVVALDAADGSVRWRAELSEHGAADGTLAHPIYAGGPIVVGTAPENRGPLPGRLIALDPADGSIVWSWSPLPSSVLEFGYDTWQPVPPSARYGIGGAGILNVGGYDPTTDTVVFGTSTATPWDRLDHRRRNDGAASHDLFVSSFVAVGGQDGGLRWYHQVVPGDEWEYDQRTVPMFVDLPGSSGLGRVALLATTTGYLVLVDAEGGVLRLAHQLTPEANVHLGYDGSGNALIDDGMRFLGEREATRVCPGGRWANVAPAAFSPRTGLLYRPNDTACVQQGRRPSLVDQHGSGDEATWLRAEPRTRGDFYDRLGALSAIDPVTGDVAWDYHTSYPHDAGALVTGGDLVFSAFADRTFRAFDAETGEVLWERVLSAHSDGSPISYAVDGVQYVAVPVGHEHGVTGVPDHGVPRSAAGTPALFVFALGDDR
jgi:alcohol dehydrogenase (cytochrome c)